MNCKQVENLLPLYVSRDLKGRREQLVASHLQACAKCESAADEYREARHLLQQFSPPTFSDDVYAEIRRNVWRDVEAKSAVPSMPEVIAAWFRPRLSWAVATAVLIVVSVLGVYFLSNRSSAPRQVVNNVPKTNQRESIEPPGPQASHHKPIDSPSAPDERKKGQRQVIRRLEPRGDRNWAPDRLDTRVANAPDAAPALPGSSVIRGIPAESLAGSTETQGRPLRMEIQTRNPNIRIIWFAQRDTKPVSPNSKGI